MQKKSFIIGLTLIITLASQLVFTKPKEVEGSAMAVPVQAVTIKPISWQPTIKAIGTLSAEQGIMVRPEITGHITQIFFQSGTFVAKDTPLIQLDQSILKAQLELYKANMALSQLNYNRSVNLFKTHAIAQADMDKAVATLHADKANVDTAQAQLNQTQINAPFSGRLGLRLISLGDYVQPGTDIVTLQQVDPINVDFSLSENYISKVQAEQKVIIRIDAYPNETFKGKVTALNSIINASNRSLGVRAIVDNKNGKLIPGGFAEVTLYIGQPQMVIQLPITSIVYSDQGNYVYKIVAGKAVKAIVKLGEHTADTIQIIGGLNADDVVITAGQQKLNEAVPVTVVPNE